jgi:hypothetical protein
MRNVEVNSCENCPFFWKGWRIDDPRFCVITYEKENNAGLNTMLVLADCPLKAGEVKVELKTKKEQQ